MQLLTTFTRLIVTVLITVLISSSTCSARRQHFSGSHSFDDDESSVSTEDGNFQEHQHQAPISEVENIEGHSSDFPCPSENVTETKGWGVQSCAPPCTKDEDCSETGFKCSCDGACGLTCSKVGEERDYCGFPGRVDNGRVLVVGKLGLYDYRNQLKRFSHNQKVIFECEGGFSIAHGPTRKTCRNGLWLPIADNPQCIESDGPSFRWIRSARKKRRAIKTGGGTFARHNNKGGGGGERGSGPGRRPSRNKGKRPGEEDDFFMGSLACPDLDHDDFMLVEVIRNGDDSNNTYSVGAVAKISCIPGFGVNLNNETVTCEKGKWRPKLPQCSALPCTVPYIIHGTFYVGSKPLFFQELKPHDIKVELRCSKGFMSRGSSKLHCWYGEWNVDDAPECVPAGCRLPHLEKGMYLMNYKADMFVASGTEVDYICDDNYQKPYSSGSARCDHGEWKPTGPRCIASELVMQRNFTLDIGPVRRGCGSPPQEKLAIAYTEGTPLDFSTNHRFPHGMEVMYRCVIVRPRTKNRWKAICDDGIWNKTGASTIICEENITDSDMLKAHEVTRLINSTCVYNKVDKNVATFHNEQEIVEDQMEYSFGTILISRCADIGKFQLKGAPRRKCISGMWMGLTPKCEGLSQYHDYAVDKSPTILFRFVNGSIAQTVDGKLIVYPGTTLHMECIYLRKFGRPAWEVSHDHRAYAEGWTDGIPDRDPTLEYRLTIDDATEKDSGIYSCSTPTRHSHQITIIVKKVDCPPLPEREDLVYSTLAATAGTRTVFTCKDNNKLVGNSEIQCQASGTWNGGLPHCEKVKCRDISLVPAMAPLANTDITRNGTLKKNETAPPKITITSRDIGGKVIFTCPQGFHVEGESEAVCQSSGEWSNDMPLCKEVECDAPPKPDNGFVNGSPPYKAGDLAHIRCNQGFMIEGREVIACQDSAKWSRPSTTTKCVPACTYPGTTIGGKISDVKFLYPIGDMVHFNCDEGYELIGEKMLRCLDSARWSHPVPSCSSGKEDKRMSRYMGLIYQDNFRNGNGMNNNNEIM